MQGHGRIIAHDFCVAHREANSGLSTLNRTKSILSIYHQQRQLQKQRGMCLNDTYPFCQQPLSGNCHSICFSKPVLWTTTTGRSFSNIPYITTYPLPRLILTPLEDLQNIVEMALLLFQLRLFLRGNALRRLLGGLLCLRGSLSGGHRL